jgi:hypothetical protein
MPRAVPFILSEVEGRTIFMQLLTVARSPIAEKCAQACRTGGASFVVPGSNS